MNSGRSSSFEWLRARIEQQPMAEGPGSRDLIWADVTHTAAVARDDRGSLEIFIIGEPLAATTPSLRHALQHQEWMNSTGMPLAANRLVLPDASNLPGVAAFICAELLANGLEVDSRRAFERTEPVIAALLQQQQLGNEALTGLTGELLLLESLTRHAVNPEAVVGAWYGYAPSARDVQLGEVGIEVKATTGAASVHAVQGFHQVELGHAVTNKPETALYLLSVGVRWLPADAVHGTSIPRLVEQIAGRLDLGSRTEFIGRLKQYGGDAGVGYDHGRHQGDQRYARLLMATFERLYDMTDGRIRVLRSSDVDGLAHIEPGSVAFRVALPHQVNGDVNPLHDLEEAVPMLLRRSHYSVR